MAELLYQIQEQDGWSVVQLAGSIDEDAGMRLEALVSSVGDQVVFDFANVRYVNSIGVRAWIVFLRTFAEGRQVAYRRCTPHVVAQLNMVPSFLAPATVESVQAPFACDSCSKITDVTLRIPDEAPEEGEQLGTRKCSHCGAEAHFEEDEDEYFDFVHR